VNNRYMKLEKLDEELSQHPEIVEVKRMVDEEDLLMMPHWATTRDIQIVRQQLEPRLNEPDLLDRFKSYMCKVDKGGQIVECWGIPTTILWPDSYLYRIRF
jgi:hypothetical protein